MPKCTDCSLPHSLTKKLQTPPYQIQLFQRVPEQSGAGSILEQKLGRLIQMIAYPYGDQDAIVQHLMGACGYLYGLTCRSGRSSYIDGLLNLPRIEICNTDSLKDFVAKLQ